MGYAWSRGFGRQGLAMACALWATMVTSQAGTPRAAVLERTHEEWLQNATGLARGLEQAGFSVQALDIEKPATQQGAALIAFSSFSSEHADYKGYMQRHGPSLIEFVERGGVVLQLTQADQTEARVPFLPEGMRAERCDDDIAPLVVRVPDHPLVAGLVTIGEPPTLRLPTYLGRPGNWESLSGFEGMRVLMSVDQANRRPILLEGQHGKGRYVLSSLYLDALYAPDGTLAAPAEYEAAARSLFGNLRGYVQAVVAGESPEVTVTPPYKDPELLPFVPGSFTLIALPDTQMYAERYPQHFHNQTQWIVDHREKFNIQYVLHLGDITNRNTPEQWEVAQAALRRLDGKVPYALAPGNHDYGPGGNASDRTTLLNEYFSVAEHTKWPTFGGVMEPGKLDNSYHVFEAGGAKFLVLALEWGPRLDTVAWANRIAAEHPEHRKILITHAYMYSDETRYNWKTRGADQRWNPHLYGTSKQPGGVTDGQELWERLVSQHSGFILTMNGHVLNDGQALLTEEGAHGDRIHQVLCNYQTWREGGEGYLRIIEFLPDGETVQMKSYSPSLDRYLTAPEHQFVLKLKPGLRAKR